MVKPRKPMSLTFYQAERRSFSTTPSAALSGGCLGRLRQEVARLLKTDSHRASHRMRGAIRCAGCQDRQQRVAQELGKRLARGQSSRCRFDNRPRRLLRKASSGGRVRPVGRSLDLRVDTILSRSLSINSENSSIAAISTEFKVDGVSE